MATIQQTISEKFLQRLVGSKDIDPGQIEQLRALLSEGKKPKPEDFVRVFSAPPGGDLE
jgi:hypothetical protein